VHRVDPVDPETFQKLRELSRYLIQAGQLVADHIPAGLDVEISVAWNAVSVFTPDQECFGIAGQMPEGEKLLAEEFAEMLRERASQFSRN